MGLSFFVKSLTQGVALGYYISPIQGFTQPNPQ